MTNHDDRTKDAQDQATGTVDPLDAGTPAGKVEDLIEEAEEEGATTNADGSPEGAAQVTRSGD